MIGYLEGTLSWQSGQKIIIDVNGVGYLVEVTGFNKILQVGDRINIFVYTYVRDDALHLYGFDTMAERKLFSTLLTVSRIGPRAALNILSSLSYGRFINAILTEDIAVLKEVSGIGPKTAQRLILELKSKVEEMSSDMQIAVPRGQQSGELYEALNNLGYSNSEINKALSGIDFAAEDMLEDKIKQVLSYLGKENF